MEIFQWKVSVRILLSQIFHLPHRSPTKRAIRPLHCSSGIWLGLFYGDFETSLSFFTHSMSHRSRGQPIRLNRTKWTCRILLPIITSNKQVFPMISPKWSPFLPHSPLGTSLTENPNDALVLVFWRRNQSILVELPELFSWGIHFDPRNHKNDCFGQLQQKLYHQRIASLVGCWRRTQSPPTEQYQWHCHMSSSLSNFEVFKRKMRAHF